MSQTVRAAVLVQVSRLDEISQATLNQIGVGAFIYDRLLARTTDELDAREDIRLVAAGDEEGAWVFPRARAQGPRSLNALD